MLRGQWRAVRLQLQLSQAAGSSAAFHNFSLLWSLLVARRPREASEARWYLSRISLSEPGPFSPARKILLSGTDAVGSHFVASLRTCHITECHNMSAFDRLDTCY